ncbi:MAG: nucleotide exchange factor GrpE [Opitutaceae bacterium]|jgi:molecular chaperone GrpE|nr:nucleotide exchange factor GrpE [Opitutaceae bacterium]NBR58272.1 nucleotide exchange factor GrpE [Opitutaceae bacterium]
MNESAPTEPKDTVQAAANDAVVKLEEQLIAAKQEAAASYDRFTRTAADLENFRKRTIREKDELRQFATAGLMEDVIPILDNLGLGLAAARQQAEGKSIVDGLVLVLEQLKSTLARHGLKEINPAGQKFDPHFHECISHQPSTEFAEELVMQVVRLGFSLNGRLLRPASVVVSSGAAGEAKV